MNFSNKISVRNLVEFVYRNGDIDSDFLRTKNMDVLALMQLGTEIHNKIQKEREREFRKEGYIYESEVSVKNTIKLQDTSITVNGRIDGMCEYPEYLFIEEIKSTSSSLEYLNFDSVMEYKAQALMYAYMQGKEKYKKAIIHITFVHSEIGTVKICEKEFTMEFLEKFFMDTVSKYYLFVELKNRIDNQMKTSGEAMNFPFDSYRKNQRELMKATFVSQVKGKKLFAQAPTGIGKTMSTLFPSIKNLSTGIGEKIFYITAKTITREVCEKSLKILENENLIIRAVTLTAKEKICFMDEVKCNPVYCPYAKGHFDKVNEALIDIVTNENIITREVVEKYSEKYCICPFEYELDISLFCQVIIGDYNYVYSPRAQLSRFFDGSSKDYFILVDEAHNLVRRAREMFSADIDKKDFLLIKKETSDLRVIRTVNKINRYFLEIGRMTEGNDIIDEPTKLYGMLDDLRNYMNKWYELEPEAKENTEILNIFFRINGFIKTAEYYNKKYRTVVKKDNGNVNIKLMALDPSDRLEETNRLCRSVIFFSATFWPLEYYSNIFAGSKDDYSIKLSSPFNEDNLLVIKDTSVSTYYKDRNQNYELIAKKIAIIINEKKGNYFVFFSSYEFMEKVYDIFWEDNYEDVEILMQSPSMTEENRSNFLKEFQDDGKMRIGFLVLGGIFSEGIDLEGNRLIGSIIVGVGLSSMNYEDDIIKDYYDIEGNCGFDYAYKIPGISKVLQGAGRVIRKESDVGVVVIMDNRYDRYDYINLLQNSWKNIKKASNCGKLKGTLKSFWESKGE